MDETAPEAKLLADRHQELDGSSESADMSLEGDSFLPGMVVVSGVGRGPSQAPPYLVYLVMSLFLFSTSVSLVCSSDVVYNKLCYSHSRNLTVCADPTLSKRHPEIQVDAARWYNYMAYVQLVPAILSNLLLSSYCDKVGHKLPLALPAIGMALANGWLAVLATPKFIDWPLELVLVTPLLYSLMGGFSMVLMSSYSYVSLTSNAENRAVRLGIAESCNAVGNILGAILNGPIIDNLGLDVMVYINVGVSVLVAAIATVFIKDISKPHLAVAGWRIVFKLGNISEMFRTIYKKRRNHHRLFINLIFLAYSAANAVICAIMGLGFLYFVKQVSMTMTQFSVLNGGGTFLKAVVSVAILSLATRFKLNEMACSFFSALSLSVGCVLLSLGTQLSYLCLFTVLTSPLIVVFGVLRNLQVKLVEADELGKLYAYDGLIQVVLTVVTTVVFDLLYTWSLTFWPQLFAAVVAALALICAAVIAVLMILISKFDPGLLL